MPIDLSILVGGEAGQGIQTIGFVLGKAMVRGGLHVFADQDYESRIRGGHNFFRVRVADKDVKTFSEKVDILIALNAQSVELHRGELKEGGIVVYDGSAFKLENPGAGLIDIPMEKMAMELGSKVMSNSAAIGAVIGLLDYDFNILAEVLRWHFAKNAREVRENNVKVAKDGFDYAKKHTPQGFKQSVKPTGEGKCMFVAGHEAVALGAMAAGCKFMAAYPMTPTTPILELMADKGRDYGIAVIQPEDEIAAINMIIGAAYAGVRAMTATSGSGFALMVEGLGLAGITETPIVVVLGQRPGPAVGLPTRTEQGELEFAVYSGTGEFPRAVLAPATVEEAFYIMPKAFNLAEKYQTPVMVMIDTELANSYSDVEKFDLTKVKIERGAFLSDEQVNLIGDYNRHELTPSGVSARARPMQGKALVITDSDEHNQKGHLIENAEDRTQQMNKRLRKYGGLRKDISAPRFEKADKAELILIGWGSTYGAIKEAAERLGREGRAASIVHFSEIWPFPEEPVLAALKEARKTVVVESNATGQLAHIIRAETGYQVHNVISRYDGRPISAQYIIDGLQKTGGKE